MILTSPKIKLIMEWYVKVIQSYSDFNGRSRKEYWMFTLWNLIFALLAMFLDYTFGIVYPSVGYGPLYIAYGLFVFIRSCSRNTKTPMMWKKRVDVSCSSYSNCWDNFG